MERNQNQQEKAALAKLERIKLDQGKRAEDLERDAAEAESKVSTAAVCTPSVNTTMDVDGLVSMLETPRKQLTCVCLAFADNMMIFPCGDFSHSHAAVGVIPLIFAVFMTGQLIHQHAGLANHFTQAISTAVQLQVLYPRLPCYIHGMLPTSRAASLVIEHHLGMPFLVIVAGPTSCCIYTSLYCLDQLAR